MYTNFIMLIIAVWGIPGVIVAFKLTDKKVGRVMNIILPILLGPLHWIAILIVAPFIINMNKTSQERPVNIFRWNKY